jgi:hypothetical protein
MTHFGLNLIDEHAMKCSELLKGVPDAEKVLGETIDFMRSRWLSYSVEKQEARLKLGVSSMKNAILPNMQPRC